VQLHKIIDSNFFFQDYFFIRKSNQYDLGHFVGTRVTKGDTARDRHLHLHHHQLHHHYRPSTSPLPLTPLTPPTLPTPPTASTDTYIVIATVTLVTATATTGITATAISRHRH
jgi:hypothetical protein